MIDLLTAVNRFNSQIKLNELPLGTALAVFKVTLGGRMNKVIQFPQKNFKKNTKQTVDVKKHKNKLTLAASILSLVLALSVFNNKMDDGFSSPNRGMRGLASVEDTSFEVNNDDLIKLINSKNTRKIASLGRKPNARDSFIFNNLLAGKFAIDYDRNNNVISVKRQKGDNENEKQFDIKLIKDNLSVFGASSIDEKGSGIKKLELQDSVRLVNSYKLFDKSGAELGEAVVVTTNLNELISIEVQ